MVEGVRWIIFDLIEKVVISFLYKLGYWGLVSGVQILSTFCFHFGLFVCLSVRPSDNWKSCERILTKFPGGVGHGPGTKWLNFGDDPDQRPDPGVRSPKSGFTGWSNRYLVDSDKIYIANLHCKNHSAILLCWRSAEVCALWVLLVHSFITWQCPIAIGRISVVLETLVPLRYTSWLSIDWLICNRC